MQEMRKMKRTRRSSVALLRIRIRGFFWRLDPGRKKFRIRDKHTRSFFREIGNVFRVNKYLNSLKQIRNLFYPGSGIFWPWILNFLTLDPESFWPWIRDQGFKKIGSVMIIPDPQHRSKMSVHVRILILLCAGRNSNLTLIVMLARHPAKSSLQLSALKLLIVCAFTKAAETATFIIFFTGNSVLW